MVGPAMSVDPTASSHRYVRIRASVTYPAVRQDLAFVLPEDVPAADVVAAMCEAGAPELRDVRVFDEYRSPELGPGKKMKVRVPDVKFLINPTLPPDYGVGRHIAVSMVCASRSPVTPLPATATSRRHRPSPPCGKSSDIVQSWRNFAR